MQKITAVIVNWNGKEDTVACLSSLKKISALGHSLSTIVVDNGSTNDSVKVISRAHPWIELVATGRNLGFTGGANIGIRKALQAGTHHVWLLNNDTLVDKKALSILKVFADSNVGIAGSKIYFAPGREFYRQRYSKGEQGRVFWYAGGIIDWANMYASHRGVDEVDQGQFDKIEETDFVSGCSMVVARPVFEKIGLLDERYYLYLEDLDFCLRAKQAGFKLLYAPQSRLWHVNAGSSGGPGNPLHEYYLTRNRLLVGWRYAPARTKIALLKEALKFVFGSKALKRRAVLDTFFGRLGKQYEQNPDTN